MDRFPITRRGSAAGSGLRGVLTAGVLMTCLALVAACGTSGSSGTSSSGGSGGPEVKAAKAATTKLLARPTSIGVTEPIGAKVPSGKKIDFVVPNVPSALAMAKPLTEAAKALGWTTTIRNAGTSPEDFVAAVEKATQSAPDGVFIAGIPPAVITRQLQALKGAKIPVITLGAPGGNVPAPSTGIIFNIAGTPYNTDAGTALANWVTADSNGKADTLAIGVPDFPGPHAVTTGFKAQLAKSCPKCKFDSMNFPADTIGQTLPQTLAGYLRTHQDVKYVVADFDDLYAGVPAALQSAGITGVKLAGNTPSTTNQVNIAAGNDEAGGYMFSLFENPWRVIDVFARTFAGKPVDASVNAPIPAWLITKDNQKSWGGPADSAWPLVKDYQAQYKKLWGVS
jgi:ABC-type sugar transport system substrate-binding protein